jgi:hypothetical protein
MMANPLPLAWQFLYSFVYLVGAFVLPTAPSRLHLELVEGLCDYKIVILSYFVITISYFVPSCDYGLCCDTKYLEIELSES